MASWYLGEMKLDFAMEYSEARKNLGSLAKSAVMRQCPIRHCQLKEALDRYQDALTAAKSM